MYWEKRKGEKCRVGYPLMNFTSHAIKRRCYSGFGPAADLDPPSQIWTPYQTFLLIMVCIILGP